MKERLRKKSKLTKKTIILIVLAVLLPVTALVGTAIAATFDVQTNLTVVKDPDGNKMYEVVTEKGVIRMRFKYVHNSKATLSYNTRYLYFTADQSDGNPTKVTNYKLDVGECANDGMGEIPRYTETEGNFTYEIFEVPVETLELIIKEVCGDEYLDNPENLENLNLYVSQGYVLKRRNTAQDEWKYDAADTASESLNEIRGAAGWSNDTWRNFQCYYDCPLLLNVAQYNVTLFTEGEGVATGPSKAYVNETVGISAYPDEGWKFAGWEVVDGPAQGLNSGSASAAFTMPGKNVTLKAKFREVIPPPPDAPDTYTLTIETDGDGTVEIISGEKDFYYGDGTERITLVATPGKDATFAGWEKNVEQGLPLEGFKTGEKNITIIMPESNVTLTASFNTPQKVDCEEKYIRYFTTDKGYSMERLYDHYRDSETYADNDYGGGYVADGYSAKGSGELGSSVATELYLNYSKGKDTSGNEWYFIPSENNATYVHPRVYKGNAVFHEGIADITELTFPETITDDYGEDYTVTSIGGGLDMYRNEKDDDVREQPSYGYTMTNGRYQFTYKDTLSDRTEEYSESAYLYFGVIGNGSVTSKGHTYSRYTNGVYEKYSYQNDYHVYNTTLKSVTIPATVTTIESYAFYNCQALETIVGGTGVTTIAANAFEGAGHKTPAISDLKLDTYGDPTAKRYYYYNKSYAFGSPTDTMLGWAASVRLSDHLVLPGNSILTPSFTSLQTIGNYAFYRRNNLRDVYLPSCVQMIGENAFAGCSLNSITVPGKDTEIYGGYPTLGTKGNVEESSKTVIITDPDTKAMSYGFAYNAYYRLKAGYRVDYHNNLTSYEIHPTQADVKMIRKNMVQAVSVSTYETSASGNSEYTYRNMVYLDEEGHLWLQKYGDGTIPSLCAEGEIFRTIETIEGSSSSYSSSMGSGGKSAYVFAIAYAENGKVYGISPNGTCTDFGIPAGSTGHLWGDMTLREYKTDNSSYGGSYALNYTTANYLYYIYNGVVYRKQVYGTLTNTYGSSSGGGGNNDYFSTSFDAPVKQISLSNMTVISFYVAPSSHNEKTEETFNGSGYYSRETSYEYSLPKIFLMTASGYCITGGNNTKQSSDNSGNETSGYDDAVFENGPGELSYVWVTLPTTDRFRQIATSSKQELGETSYTVDTPGGSQLHPSSYDNILAIDNSGNLIYVRDINKVSNGYLHCGIAVTVSAGKNFKSITALGDGAFLLTDVSGGTWKYVESMGSITAYDTNTLLKQEIVATLAVDYEFVAIMPDPYRIFTVVGDEFLGWALNADGTGMIRQVDDEAPIKGTTTFYAQWDDESGNDDSIIIQYHPNTPDGCKVSGFMGEDVCAVNELPIQLKKNTYTCTCGKHKFTGFWNTKADGTGKSYADEAMIYVLSPGTTVLYAQWETITADEFSYTVKIAKYPRGTSPQDFDTFVLSYEDTKELPPIAGGSRTVEYYLNTHSSMSTQGSFAWASPLSVANTTALINTADCEWELYDETVPSKTRYIKTCEQSEEVSANTLKDRFGDSVVYNGAILVFYPDTGESGSVELPEVYSPGYELRGYTKAFAYAPGELPDDAELITGTFYGPTDDMEYLYAYYEPKTYSLYFYDEQEMYTGLDGVSPNRTCFVTFDRVVYEAAVPSKQGYVFKGYYDAINEDGMLPENAKQYFDKNGSFISGETWTEVLPKDKSYKDLFAYWSREEFPTGQLYGFEIFRVFGSPAWEETEAESLCYTVGVREGESVWETLPLRTGVHPKYRNLGGLPQGGGFAFRVRSTGIFSGEDTILTVYPVLVSVTENGYREVDVYFEEESPQGCFLKKWEAEEQAVVLYGAEASDWDAETMVRLWNGNFILPERLWIAEKNTDVAEYQRRYGLNFKEEFWITGERLLLRLGMRTENKEGEVLFYGMIPEGIVENIWKTEAKDSYREDNNGNRYEIQGGEVAVIYPGEYSGEEYKTNGIY